MSRADDALGLLEVRGITAAIGAADVMAKAALVEVLGPALIGDGLVTLFVRGEIAAVREALDAGSRSAQGFGLLRACRLIGRPVPELDRVFGIPLPVPP